MSQEELYRELMAYRARAFAGQVADQIIWEMETGKLTPGGEYRTWRFLYASARPSEVQEALRVLEQEKLLKVTGDDTFVVTADAAQATAWMAEWVEAAG